VKQGRAVRLVLAAVLALFLAVFARPGLAAEPPIIVAGREAEIVALVRPHFGDGKQIAPGYAIGNVNVEPHSIRYRVDGPAGAKGALLLEHSSVAHEGAERTKSFTITLEGTNDPGMGAALRTLVEAIRANDEGTFWPTAAASEHAPSRFGGRGPPRPWVESPRLLLDGFAIFLAASTVLALHLWRVLRSEPRRVLLTLLGLVALGALLRLLIAREAPMNVWSYQRVVPLARAVFEGATLRAIARGWPDAPLYLTDVIFKTTTVLAIASPFAFFAHARYVLRDTRGALFATALLVTLPMHIHFSRADSEFIQSLATSSLTFVVLYTALRDPSRGWRAICLVLLPVLSVATYFVRPENLFFYFVDLGAVALTSGEEAPRRRRFLVVVELTIAAGFAFVAHLLAQYRAALSAGLSVQTVWSAIRLFFDVRLNTLINPAITPPLVALLALAGAVFLYRRGERARALFLTSWLLGFFVVHSFVRPSEPAMQARYHMHLITPLLLLAASSLPELSRLRPRLKLAGAATILAAPFAHLPFERDIYFNEMNEFAFFREVRRDIPDGCTVLEFSPVATLGRSELLASRLDRIGTRLSPDGVARSFRVVNAGKPGAEHETLSDEALGLLKNPPSCLLVYEGLTCATHKPRGARRAPVCQELRERLALQTIATMSFSSRVYDEAIAGPMKMTASGDTMCDVTVAPGETITLTLSRATAAPR